MEVSDQLHAPATLPPGKELPVPIGQEGGWAPKSVNIHNYYDLARKM